MRPIGSLAARLCILCARRKDADKDRWVARETREFTPRTSRECENTRFRGLIHTPCEFGRFNDGIRATVSS